MSEPKEPKLGMPPTPDNANRDVLTFEEFISRDSHGAAKHNIFICILKAHLIMLIRLTIEDLQTRIQI